LVTDTVVACAVADRISRTYDVLLLPPVTITCSQHAGFAGTVSIRSSTLASIVDDVADSLQSNGVPHLVVVNGHGGNYGYATE